MITIIKFVSLVIAIWVSIVNFALIKYRENVPIGNLIVQAVSIATFIFIQFDLF